MWPSVVVSNILGKTCLFRIINRPAHRIRSSGQRVYLFETPKQYWASAVRPFQAQAGGKAYPGQPIRDPEHQLPGKALSQNTHSYKLLTGDGHESSMRQRTLQHVCATHKLTCKGRCMQKPELTWKFNVLRRSRFLFQPLLQKSNHPLKHWNPIIPNKLTIWPLPQKHRFGGVAGFWEIATKLANIFCVYSPCSPPQKDLLGQTDKSVWGHVTSSRNAVLTLRLRMACPAGAAREGAWGRKARAGAVKASASGSSMGGDLVKSGSAHRGVGRVTKKHDIPGPNGSRGRIYRIYRICRVIRMFRFILTNI